MKTKWVRGHLGVFLAGVALVALCRETWAAERADDGSGALFNGGLIPRLEIQVPAAGMKTLREYRQVWGQPRPERVDVQVTVREGGRTYTNVALHLKGSYTFQPVDEKPSLTLNFDKFARGQRFHGLDKIHLNNSVQDPSFVCEKLARELFADAGVPAARTGHARASLNGRDLGFYVLVEGYNKRFLRRHFPSVKGNLYDGGSGGDITKELEIDSGEGPADRADLHALVAAAREPDPARRAAELERQIDMNRFLSFAALEVLLLHWDGYSLGPNNYRLFRDASTDRFVFLPHGLDQILGRGMSLSTSLTPKWDGLVARVLFKLSGPRGRYLDRVRQTFTNQFQTADLHARVDRIVDRIRASDVLRPPEFRALESAADELKQRIARRVDLVRGQIENPPSPLVFPPGGELRLSGWQLNRSSRGGASGRSARIDDRNVLEVRVTGGRWSSGSWRKTVLLGAGRYELSGLARVEGLTPSPTNGVVLRLSGDVEIVGLTNAAGWVTLRHEFELAGESEEQLVCEFRGPDGAGFFDLSSLKLRRLEERTPAPAFRPAR